MMGLWPVDQTCINVRLGLETATLAGVNSILNRLDRRCRTRSGKEIYSSSRNGSFFPVDGSPHLSVRGRRGNRATRRLHQKDRVRDIAIEGGEAVRFSMSSMSSKFRKVLDAWGRYGRVQAYAMLYEAV
jgi:hypothetical protein